MEPMELEENCEEKDDSPICNGGYWNFGEVIGIENKVERLKSELLECRKECELTETKRHHTSLLKDKGLFVLKTVERKYKDLDEELKNIHGNHMKCMKKENLDVNQVLNSATLKRDNLRKELIELRNTTEENSRKLQEIKKMITAQEKKNMALLRKLRKKVERTSVTQEIRKRMNALLIDPRITKLNVPTDNNV